MFKILFIERLNNYLVFRIHNVGNNSTMATIIPAIKILELKNREYMGSEEDVKGNLIELTNDVKRIYPKTKSGRNLPHPAILGRFFGI